MNLLEEGGVHGGDERDEGVDTVHSGRVFAGDIRSALNRGRFKVFRGVKQANIFVAAFEFQPAVISRYPNLLQLEGVQGPSLRGCSPIPP
jgi:hypothetical protein